MNKVYFYSLYFHILLPIKSTKWFSKRRAPTLLYDSFVHDKGIPNNSSASCITCNAASNLFWANFVSYTKRNIKPVIWKVISSHIFSISTSMKFVEHFILVFFVLAWFWICKVLFICRAASSTGKMYLGTE